MQVCFSTNYTLVIVLKLAGKGIGKLQCSSALHLLILFMALEYVFQLFMDRPWLAFFARIMAVLGMTPNLVNVSGLYQPSPLYFIQVVDCGDTEPKKFIRFMAHLLLCL